MGNHSALPTAQLADRRWRLANLYTCLSKSGKRIPFKPNWAQTKLLDDLHHSNIVLKARQPGLSTLIQAYLLDMALFNSSVRAATVCHKLDDAKVMFQTKIRDTYNALPDVLK